MDILRITQNPKLPIEAADGTYTDIEVYGCLEQVPYFEIPALIKHWKSKLAEGGSLKIAVVNFQKVAEDYIAGVPVDIQGAVMGKQGLQHGTIFDFDALKELFVENEFERLGAWLPNPEDGVEAQKVFNTYHCGIQGFKASSIPDFSKIKAVLSAPRTGYILHFRSAFQSFGALGIQYTIHTGAYWHQNMCNAIEEQLKNPDCEYVLTLDYDSIFNPQDVVQLLRLINTSPDVHAVCAVQSKRGADNPLFTIQGADGKNKSNAYLNDFQRNLTKITTGHFGLTLFRADALRGFKRPWMMPQPAPDGTWGEGKIDADIDFWFKWRDANLNLYMANRVPIGHIEELVMWPTPTLGKSTQLYRDYLEHGMPMEVQR